MAFNGSFGAGMIAGAADSFLGAAGNALFGGISAGRQWKYQKKQMALQNQYNLDSMWYQHQYNMDAWNKENEYNDPTAVRARYEAAGISPQAALGGSVNAGIAGSMSTPSSNPPSGGADYSGRNGINPSALTAMATLQSINESKARQKKTEADTAGQNITNGILDTNAQIAKLEQDNRSVQLEVSKINKRVAAATESGNVQRVYADLLNVRATYDKLLADTAISQESKSLIQAQVKAIDADIALRNAQTGKTHAETATEGARQANIEADTSLKNEQAATESYKRLFLDSNSKKLDVDSDVGKATIRRIDADIARIGKEMELADENIRLAQQKFEYLVKYNELSIALANQDNIRKWLYGWIPMASGGSGASSGKSTYWE